MRFEVNNKSFVLLSLRLFVLNDDKDLYNKVVLENIYKSSCKLNIIIINVIVSESESKKIINLEVKFWKEIRLHVAFSLAYILVRSDMI